MAVEMNTGARAASAAARVKMAAPVQTQRTGAQEKPGEAKPSPAYTVEISDEAREKYRAARKEQAQKEQEEREQQQKQDRADNAKNPAVPAQNEAAKKKRNPAGDRDAKTTDPPLNAAQQQADKTDKADKANEKDREKKDDAKKAEKEAHKNADRKKMRALETRLDRMRKKLAALKHSALPEEEKKTQIAALKQRIQTLAMQVRTQKGY